MRGLGTRSVSWIDAERNKLAAVYKEATLNAVVGVNQTIGTIADDVADRFRRRLLEHRPHVGRHRARPPPSIMKELRYGIFPAVHRFKDCYLAVLMLKMTSHPCPSSSSTLPRPSSVASTPTLALTPLLRQSCRTLR